MVLPHLTERSTHPPSESLLIIVTKVGDTEIGGSPISNQKQALIKLGEILRSYCPPSYSGINKLGLPRLLSEVEAPTPCLKSPDTHRPSLGTEPCLQSHWTWGRGCCGFPCFHACRGRRAFSADGQGSLRVSLHKGVRVLFVPFHSSHLAAPLAGSPTGVSEPL